MNYRPDSIIHFRLHYFHTEQINSFFVTEKKKERERERMAKRICVRKYN